MIINLIKIFNDKSLVKKKDHFLIRRVFVKDNLSYL